VSVKTTSQKKKSLKNNFMTYLNKEIQDKLRSGALICMEALDCHDCIDCIGAGDMHIFPPFELPVMMKVIYRLYLDYQYPNAVEKSIEEVVYKLAIFFQTFRNNEIARHLILELFQKYESLG
jgi:hypothetical protein